MIVRHFSSFNAERAVREGAEPSARFDLLEGLSVTLSHIGISIDENGLSVFAMEDGKPTRNVIATISDKPGQRVEFTI